LLEQHLDAVERQAAEALARAVPGLRCDGVAVRRSGTAWFWGPPFRLGPDVSADAVVPEPFAAMVATWAEEQVDDGIVLKRLLGDDSLLHDAAARPAALRMIFALGLRADRPWQFVDELTSHWDGGVRAVSLGLLGLLAGRSAAQRRIAALTHDTDDRVFLKAFRVLGALRVEAALPDLLHIMHRPSAGQALTRLGHDANPVGLGAAHVMLAIVQIVGSDDPGDIRRIEDLLPPSAALHSERFEADGVIRRCTPGKHSVPPAAGRLDVPMVDVPGGDVRVGIDEWQVVGCHFRQRNRPARRVRLAPYRIAAEPVTNEVYYTFLVDWQRRGGREFEHPLQPEGKDHWPATFGDPRHGPSHPVAGVDWFDAYAFCSFYGVRLPSEDEWEWAARGPEDHSVGEPHAFTAAYGEPFLHLNQWRRILNETGPDYPARTTASVDDDQVSGFGLRHALGNVWEYTATNPYSGTPMTECLPDVRLRPDAYMSLWPYHVVIKGGAWTSVGDLLWSAYRGTDLYTDRHQEIGFRIAADA
jgi:formylglycine-generating enzyme required for sulfatase activity